MTMTGETVMQIAGEFGCDLEVRSIKKYGESGVRIANVLLKTQVADDLAEERFGADFLHVAFSGMRIVDGVAKHACARIMKPALVCEVHDIELLGHKIRCSPEIPVIETIEGESAVVVHIILPLPCDAEQAEMIGQVGVHCGEIVRPTWQSVQIALPLKSGKSKKPAPVVKKVAQGSFGNPAPKLV